MRARARPLLLLSLVLLCRGEASAREFGGPQGPPLRFPSSSPPPSFTHGLDGWAGKLVTGGYVEARGWAIDVAARAPIRKMEIRLDGWAAGDVMTGAYRPDVAQAFGEPAFGWSAWRAAASLRGLAPGSHHVEVIAFPRRGDPFLCAARDIVVRDFSVESSSVGSELATILLRSLLFLLWLALLGCGFFRATRARLPSFLAPHAGLALLAIAIEWGALAGFRPLASCVFLTALSLIPFAFFHPFRSMRWPARWTPAVAVMALAAGFAFSAAIPIAAHGRGAVLGTIADAPWECSVADSIARFGWKIPAQVQGSLGFIPRDWRGVHFRAGTPYPLALLSQTTGKRAHEVHTVFGITMGLLIVLGAAALARTVLRSRPWRFLPVALVASSGVLFAGMYNQHIGLAAAVALYLFFLTVLLGVFRRRRPLRLRAFAPLSLAIAAEWTLYPETMVLWVGTAMVAWVVFPGRSRLALARAFVLVALLAAAANPVGLVRASRFTIEQRHPAALATSEARMTFGDTYYFPSMAIVAGFEPYFLDAPAELGRLAHPAEWFAILLVGMISVVGLKSARSREIRSLLVLSVPVAGALLANRVLKFPYGYSKALLHAVPLWSVCFAMLLFSARRTFSTWRGRQWRFLARAGATASVLLTLAFSVRSSLHVAGRASRAVPGYDPAYREITALAQGVAPDSVIAVDEPIRFRREWIAYFAGEQKVVQLARGAQLPRTLEPRQSFRLIDRRDEGDGAPCPANTQCSVFALGPNGSPPI